MEYIREGVIITSDKGNFLVVEFNERGYDGVFYKYLLIEVDSFRTYGWYTSAEEIENYHDINNIYLATIDKSFIY